MIKRPDFGAFFLRAMSKVLPPLLAPTRPYWPLLALTCPYSSYHNRIRAVAAVESRAREESAGEQRSCEGLDDG